MSKPYVPPSDDDFNDIPPFDKISLEEDMSSLNDFSNFDWKNYMSKSEEKPPLNFELEGKSVTVYGGSCHHPVIEDADLYVSLDVEQPVYYWEQPWYEDEGKKHIRFPIEDMFIPDDSEDFRCCIEHIQYALSQGKKVHVGCIGGHGRTGMVLSALVQESMGEKLFDEQGNRVSAIDYVRENYAKKAVETVPQILFLHYNFGIDLPKGSEKEVATFLDFFEKEVGIPLDEIINKGAEFDEIFDVLKEVDSRMFSQMKFARAPVGKSDFLSPPHLDNKDNLSNPFANTKPKF